MAKKILIVDDERNICKILEQFLKEKGFETASAYTGAEGLKKIKEFSPDLAVFDVMLPDTTGWQLLRTVKGSDNTKSIPVLMLTQKDLVSDIEMAINLGAQGYLIKPFEIDRVLSKITEILGKPS